MNQAELDALCTMAMSYLKIGITQDILDFHTSWHRREGGLAEWNSLNTTWPMLGATNYNSVGVKNYPTLKTGAQALAATLGQSYYPHIIHGLTSGRPWYYLASMAPDFRTWSGGGYNTIPVYHSQGDTDMTPQESAQLNSVTAAVGRLEVAVEDPTGGLRKLVIDLSGKVDQLLAKGQ